MAFAGGGGENGEENVVGMGLSDHNEWPVLVVIYDAQLQVTPEKPPPYLPSRPNDPSQL